jgi:serine/threonine protein kinase
MSELTSGDVVGGVRIDGVIGRGGMGVVYRGTQLALKRTVALKVVRDDLADSPEFRRRFTQESEIAASLDHPHIVPIYSAGEDAGRLHVTMRFVDGTDLRDMIKARGRLDPRMAAEIVAQVASALDAAHHRGLVHRDVKPANILMSMADGRPHAYLTDFGLSRFADSAGITRTGTMVGTLDYMAPEQFEGRAVDGRVDTYALGCVLHQALTGHVPFPRDTEHAKMWAHMSEPPPRPSAMAPHLPPGFDAAVARAMAKKPAERYATSGELGMAAVAAASGGFPAWGGHPSVRTEAIPVVAATTTGPPPTAIDSRPQQWRPPQPSGGWAPPGPPSHPSYPLTPMPPAPAPRRRRTALVLTLVGVLVAGAAATGYVLLRPAGPAPGPDPVVAAGTLVGQPIAVGKEPYDIEVGDGFVWTANVSEDTISKIDPRTGVAQQIKVGGVPTEVAVGGGGVWVWNFSDGVTRVDVASGAVSASINGGGSQIDGIAVGGGYLWMSHKAEGTVTRIDLDTRVLVGAPIRVGKAPISMAFGKRTLYVVDDVERTITTIGVDGTVLGKPLKLNDDLGGVAVQNGTIYVGSTDDVTPIDEASFVVGEPIPLKGGSLFAPDAVDGIWVAFPLVNEVRRFDLQGKETRGGPVTGVGKCIGDLALLDGTLWLTDGPGNAVRQIKTTS